MCGLPNEKKEYLCLVVMTIEELDILRSDDVRRAIDENIERDPSAVALDKRVPHASLVATQVKYLQRARRKLPSLYAVRCIIPPRAFEQCSSEDCAERKHISGGSVLDLTCGLGIDAMALSRRFERVVAIERDEVLAEVVRYNMSLLGIDNVEVVTASSEEYVASSKEHFDWVFADPDRRSSDGRKMVCLEDCSPDMLSLLPRLRTMSKRVAMKLSPLFDCDEAFRLCSPAEVEVVSVAGECKEVNIYTSAERNLLRIAMVGVGEWEFAPEAMVAAPSTGSFEAGKWRYMLIPDVALQKARVAIAALRDYASIWSNNGYAFAREMPDVALPVRAYRIKAIEQYNPRELKRRFKGVGVELLKRDCRLAADAVRKASGMKPGGEAMVAITTIDNKNWVVELDAAPITE